MVAIAQRMLDAAFALNAAVNADLRRLGVIETAHTFTWNGGSVGEVVIEAVPSVDYVGEGQVLETVTLSAASPKVDTRVIHGPYPVLRHRITTPLNEGGTVTSRIDGSE